MNSEMSESNQTVKMAGVFTSKSIKISPSNNITDPIKYCYNFNESGECRFGASCIYSHNKDPNHVTREPRDKPINNDTSKFSPKHVNKSNITPTGGEKFEGGYKRKNPKVKFNKVNSLGDSASFKSITVNKIGEQPKSQSYLLPFQSWYNLEL